MKVLCNLATKKIESFSRWDGIPFNPITHIVIDVQDVPNLETDTLNSAGDGIDIAPAPSEAEVAKQAYIKSVSDALQAVMDADAQSLGYDNINTVVSYADESSVAKFSGEGKSFRRWRSKVWEYAYGELATYEAELAAYPSALVQHNDDMVQYNLDKAQYDIDIIAEPPITPTPIEPTLPVAPDEVVAPTIDEIVNGMPAR